MREGEDSGKKAWCFWLRRGGGKSKGQRRGGA